MPPKQTKHSKMEEEMEEIKKRLDRLSADMGQISTQQTQLMVLLSEVAQLKTIINEKDKKINELEKRMDNLEQYTRMEDLIITGLETTHKTYARAVTASETDKGEEAPAEELQTLEQQVIKFFEGNDMTISSDAISACHTLPRKDGNSTPVIIVRFANRKGKTELLRQGKKLAGTGVYVNEHLTRKNAVIAKEARSLWKKEKKSKKHGRGTVRSLSN